MGRLVFEMVKDVWTSDEAGLYLTFTTVGGVIRYAQALAERMTGDKTLYVGIHYRDTRRIGVKSLRELLAYSQETLWSRDSDDTEPLMTVSPGYLIKQGEKPEELFE
tara:strand:+ start:26 stop:346 length:321 start_codon:yes stop_codon:yes gene_type:complete